VGASCRPRLGPHGISRSTWCPVHTHARTHTHTHTHAHTHTHIQRGFSIVVAEAAADDGSRLRRSAELLLVDAWGNPADAGALPSVQLALLQVCPGVPSSTLEYPGVPADHVLPLAHVALPSNGEYPGVPSSTLEYHVLPLAHIALPSIREYP
jgi:hypothetical protein